MAKGRLGTYRHVRTNNIHIAIGYNSGMYLTVTRRKEGARVSWENHVDLTYVSDSLDAVQVIPVIGNARRIWAVTIQGNLVYLVETVGGDAKSYNAADLSGLEEVVEAAHLGGAPSELAPGLLPLWQNRGLIETAWKRDGA